MHEESLIIAGSYAAKDTSYFVGYHFLVEQFLGLGFYLFP
jgi:hypothetical protein